MEVSIEHLEELLGGYYLSDDESSVDSLASGPYSYSEEAKPPPLKNIAYSSRDDGDFCDHILLQNNDPKLASLAIGEDDPIFPGDDDDQWGVLGTYLGNSEYLTDLSFGYLGGCHKYQIIDLCTGLARNRSIARLRIHDSSIFHHDHFLRLVPFLQKNVNLRHLVLAPSDEDNEDNYLGRTIKLKEKGILMLALALAKFESLETVEFVDVGDGRELDDDLAPYIFDALRCHPRLVSIRLKGTKLGRKAKEALSKLDVEVGDAACPFMPPGYNEMNNLFGRLGGLGRSNNHNGPTKVPERVVPTKVQPGIICTVNGLKSEGGKRLNGRRCAILRFVEEEGRYEVRMEHEPDGDRTYALKEANLGIQPKLVLPTHSSRGSFSTPLSLCELLLYYKGSGPGFDPEFSPSRIALRGRAASSLSLIDQSQLMWLVQVQMEQMAGVLGLASMCEECEEGAEGVLFALLEGDPMYVDVLLQTIHWTGHIDHESCDDEEHSGFNGPPTELTPDQDSKAYMNFMSQGPLRLMVEMRKFKFGAALWAALEESEFYHLFIRRLLRLVARESLGTRDGTKLAPMARKILQSFLPGINLRPLIGTPSAAKDVLRRIGTFPRAEDKITPESINALIEGECG